MSFSLISLTTHENLIYMVPVSRIRAIAEIMANEQGTLSSVLWEAEEGRILEREFKEPVNVIENKLHNVGVDYS